MAVNDVSMLPKRVRSMEQMADLLNTEQAELTSVSRTIAALHNQLVISTSTFLLFRHEKILGLHTNTEDNLETRRARLLAKLNTRGSTTVRAIQEVVWTIMGCKADVVEHFINNSFSVFIHLPLSIHTSRIRDTLQQIEGIKPAHLTFNIVVAINPISVHSPPGLLIIRKLAFIFCISNIGEGEVIVFDGQRRFDGTWLLNQAFRGAALEKLAVRLALEERGRANLDGIALGGVAVRTGEGTALSQVSAAAGLPNTQRTEHRRLAWGVGVRQNYGLSGTLTRDSMWRFDGPIRFDGSRKFNAAIKKEEI